MKPNNINKLCKNCKKQCKQWANITIVVCPNNKKEAKVKND